MSGDGIAVVPPAASDDGDVSTDCYDEDDDPVVLAVCESDLPEVTRSERGYWLVKGEVCARDTTADTMRRRVEDALARAARLEAIRRAIAAHEQAAADTEKAWDEGYRAGADDMSDLLAGRLTFQTITSNPYRQEAER